MKIVSEIMDLRQACSQLAQPIGLVPTMGYLHAGHLALVQQAQKECKSVVVSIFVNPTQFGPKEDLNAYPRDLERDIALLQEAGVDLLWTPNNAVMYPAGYQTWVAVEDVSQPLEGAYRPGHFRGVATVVAKLFNAVQPQRAYFGQKDAQQVAVISAMARDLNFALEMVIVPTMREPDGLAMSSRNAYLNPEERRAAVVLHRALCAAQADVEAGQCDAETLRQKMRQILAAEPLAQVQYVSCAGVDSLRELDGPITQALFSLAVYIGKTRLIDNFIYRSGRWQTGQTRPA